MSLKNPYETRGRKRLVKYNTILKFIRSKAGRARHGEISFNSEDPAGDAAQFRALTAFKELQSECPGMLFTIFTRRDSFLVVWEEGCH